MELKPGDVVKVKKFINIHGHKVAITLDAKLLFFSQEGYWIGKLTDGSDFVRLIRK